MSRRPLIRAYDISACIAGAHTRARARVYTLSSSDVGLPDLQHASRGFIMTLVDL